MVAKAKSDVDQATSGASGASVGADQQTAGAAGTTTGWSDVSFKSQTDVAVEEAISMDSASQANYSQMSVQRALRNQDVIDNLTHQLLQNAVENANLVGKQAIRSSEQSIRHSDLAIDRQWNPDEQGYQVTQILTALADMVKKAGVDKE